MRLWSGKQPRRRLTESQRITMDHSGFTLLRKTDQKNGEGRYLHEVQ